MLEILQTLKITKFSQIVTIFSIEESLLLRRGEKTNFLTNFQKNIYDFQSSSVNLQQNSIKIH